MEYLPKGIDRNKKIDKALRVESEREREASGNYDRCRAGNWSGCVRELLWTRTHGPSEIALSTAICNILPPPF